MVFGAFAALLAVAGWSTPAVALPSFAQQTGQPCSACHVGALGPQLKPYGRDFKLFGYVNSDGKNTLPTISAIITGSYTQTQADRTPPPGYARNDNVAFQSALLGYGGSLFAGAGAFAEASYDGIHNIWSVSRLDIKRAFNPTVQGKDVVVGLDFNNAPTVQDLWNSTPMFEFNTATSAFTASPSASTLVDGKLAGRVMGTGVYVLWNDLIYGEVTAYSPVSNKLAARMGLTTPLNADVYTGTDPYWRLALQHSFHDAHYLEVGAYGLTASRLPTGLGGDGSDRLTDTAVDATYQYLGGKKSFVSAHATYIHEDEDLEASRFLFKTHATDRLDVARADLIYSYDDTWTPAAEVFQTTGSTDKRFFKTPNGSPNSKGYAVELSYTPWGKPNSPLAWANARFTLRYVGYDQFNGRTAGASANNTLYFSTKLALAPFGAFVAR